jgi:hypothetical protein
MDQVISRLFQQSVMTAHVCGSARVYPVPRQRLSAG